MPSAGNKTVKLERQKCSVADTAAKIFAAAHQRQHPGEGTPTFSKGELRLGRQFASRIAQGHGRPTAQLFAFRKSDLSLDPTGERIAVQILVLKLGRNWRPDRIYE